MLRSYVICLLATVFPLSSYGADASNSDNEDAELSTISVTGQEDDGPKISTKKLLKVPGAGNDPLKAIESLPGVVLGGFGPFSLPAVRGSSPRDNIFITDFIPVGYVFHNDSYSTYNDNLVEDFKLLTGAWGPQYRNALGAVMDTRLRDPYHEDLTTTVDLSFIRAGALVEGSINEDQAFYLSYRESLLQFYVENFVDEDELEFTEVPTNNDYQAKYHWRLDNVSNLRFVATGAKDNVGIEFAEESDQLQREPALAGGVNANTFYNSQGILYDTVFSNGTSVLSSFSHKDEDVSFVAGSLLDLDAINEEYRFKSHFTTPLSNGNAIRYGLDIETWEIRYTATGRDNPCNNELETCEPASLGDPITDKDNLVLNAGALFAAHDWLVTPKWQLSSGFSTSKNDFTNEFMFQPRFSSRYELNHALTLTAAVGKHSQFIRDFRFVTKKYGNPDLNLPTAEHYVLGFEYKLRDSWSMKLESYYKDIHDLVATNPEYNADTNPDVVKYINTIEGEAFGLEFLLNKNLTDAWYGWLSISYSETNRTNTATRESFRFAYDRPWVVNLVTSYKYSEKTTLGLKWRYQSGALFSPVDKDDPSHAVYQCGDDFQLTDTCSDGSTVSPFLYAPHYKGQNSERLPAYHRLDLRADYEAEKDLTYYFEIINAYNRNNVSDYSYNQDYTEREEVGSLPTIFSIGLKAVF